MERVAAETSVTLGAFTSPPLLLPLQPCHHHHLSETVWGKQPSAAFPAVCPGVWVTTPSQSVGAVEGDSHLPSGVIGSSFTWSSGQTESRDKNRNSQLLPGG